MINFIICKNFKDPHEIAVQIHNLEHDGDQISHLIYNEINRVFVTPLDREDILALTSSLDNVIDLIHGSASTITTHNVKRITPIAKEFSEIIVSSTKLVAQTLPRLRNRRGFSHVSKAIVRLNELENEADDLLRKGLAQLFKNSKNPIDVLRWKDIYEIMEDVTDQTEDIANILRNLVTKYA